MNQERLTAQMDRRRDSRASGKLPTSRNTAGSCFFWGHAHPGDLVRCLSLLGILILTASDALAQDRPRTAPQEEKPVNGKPKPLEDRILDQLIGRVAVSARALEVGESASERISKVPALAPGAPPLLSFRYFDGNQRHRFGNVGLVMDDAGH